MINIEKHSDQAALIGRIFFSSMFLLFGYGKLTGYAGTVSYTGSLGLPAPAVFTVLAIIIEIGGGLLVLVGYQTRLVSLGLAIFVLVARSFRRHDSPW
jgi:putative oxidoreductase